VRFAVTILTLAP